MNHWTKAGIVGLVGSLIMFLFMMLGIHGTGIAPFNIPPSAAFLTKLGLAAGPLPLIVHFGYGAFWSILLVYLFKNKTDLGRGIGLALAAWLIMMLIYSPIIGWGVFGFGTAHTLAPSDPLYLEAGPKYLIMTLALHLIFGAVIGWLNPKWIDLENVA
ncbi:MAG: hypothetical protein U5K69_03180 [Balneolaceae bacterium]|nr:hypothetical protein [Balneolaceae bacterium]